MKTGKKKKTGIVVALLVAAAVVLGVVLPLLPKPAPKAVKLGSAQTGTAFSDAWTVAAVNARGDSFLVDTATGSVALETADGTVFNACSADAAVNGLAAALNVVVRDRRGNTYEMDSTSNSVAYNSFAYEAGSGDEPSRLVFDFYKDAAAAKKGPDFTSGSFYLRAALCLSTNDGELTASLDASAIEHANGLTVESVSLLPGLLSNSSPVPGDTYTVPDGCGAVIDLTDASSTEPLALSLPVYGTDIAFQDYAAGAYLPVFAASRSGAAVTAVLTAGDALGCVHAERFLTGGGSLYNRFTLCPGAYRDGRYRSGVPYEGTVEQTYFVAEDTGDPASTAAVTRRALRAMNYLTDHPDFSSGELPFVIGLIGSPDGSEIATTYGEAAEIVAMLKSKGLQNGAVRYFGALKGGLDQTGQRFALSSSLGGLSAYNALCRSAATEGFGVYAELNLLTSSTENRRLYGSCDVYALQRAALMRESEDAGLCNFADVSRRLSRAFSFTSKLENAGYVVGDASFLLYSDTKNGLTRQASLELLRDKLSSLAVNGKVMLAAPAVYLLDTASAVAQVPDDASCSGLPGVTTVPLLQMTLHGTVRYGTLPVNLTSDPALMLLRAAESGASPSFLFTYRDVAGLEYGLRASETASYYADLRALRAVMDLEITSRETVTAGVYKVTYGYSKVVYVNYNPSVVSVEGVYIDALSFVVI